MKTDPKSKFVKFHVAPEKGIDMGAIVDTNPNTGEHVVQLVNGAKVYGVRESEIARLAKKQ